MSNLKSFSFMTSVDDENLSYAYMGCPRNIEKSKCPYLRLYLELEVDVWLDFDAEIYYASHIYHLSVSDLKSFSFMASVDDKNLLYAYMGLSLASS